MSGFANFAELVQLVIDYAHRPDLEERCENVFIPFSSLRLGRDLRSSANEAIAVLDADALGDPFPVPIDFGSIRSITPQGTHQRALKFRDEVAIQSMPTNGPRALYYNIRNEEITVRPFRGVLYDFSYHTVPELDATTTTNAVLTRYPMLYLYAAMVEIHTWTQDAAQRTVALQTYVEEVKVVNRQQARARQNAPAGVGV